MFLLWPSQQTFRIASKQVLDGADDDLRQELLDRLVDSRLVGPTFQVSSNNDPSRLPMRELPHGSWMNMYLLYKAYARSRNETPASLSTFFAVVQEWKVCIKFHRRTHHQICLTCSTLRSALLNTDEPPFDFNIFFGTLTLPISRSCAWFWCNTCWRISWRQGLSKDQRDFWQATWSLHGGLEGPPGLLPSPSAGQVSIGPSGDDSGLFR